MNIEDKQSLINQVSAIVGDVTELQKFNQVINQPPKEEWIKQNKYSDNANYLPIRIVEQLLRMIFGVFQIEIVESKVVINSVIVTCHLKVWHPVLKEWITYAGLGAVPIELEKGSNAAEGDKIKHKALHKNAPAALSFAVSNAAKKIGSLFGADLNNQDDETAVFIPMWRGQISEKQFYYLNGLLDNIDWGKDKERVEWYYKERLQFARDNNDWQVYKEVKHSLEQQMAARYLNPVIAGNNANQSDIKEAIQQAIDKEEFYEKNQTEL